MRRAWCVDASLVVDIASRSGTARLYGQRVSDGPTYYAHLTFNAPLSDVRADALVRRLALHSPGTALDVGCGWGELLLRLAAASPTTRATGIDTDERLLERGRRAAEERGLSQRVSFENRPGADVDSVADLVICIGSTHAVSTDITEALGRLHDFVAPGGRLLLGEGFWAPVGPFDEELVWDDVRALPDLAGLVDSAVAAGFRPLYVERAGRDEWDAFESSYLADIEEWLVQHPDDPRADAERRQADEHRNRWLRGYGHGLGFGYLTLGKPR
jgi:SAM-dependent methyltransferase